MRARDLVSVGLILPGTAFTLAFFVVPMVLLLAYAFLGYAGGEVVYRPTLAQFASLAFDPFYRAIILRTVAISLATTVLCAVLGYPVALGIVRAGERWRPLLVTLILTPLLIGGVVRSYGWILILDEHGVVNGLLLATGIVDRPIVMLFNFFGVLIAMVEVLIPFFILPLMGTLSSIEVGLENAALSLGARRWQAFSRVTLPLSVGGILAGASIVFSLALNIFVVPRIIGGPSYMVLATLAYQQVGEVGNVPFGSALSVLMLLLTLAVVVTVNRFALARWRPVVAA